MAKAMSPATLDVLAICDAFPAGPPSLQARDSLRSLAALGRRSAESTSGAAGIAVEWTVMPSGFASKPRASDETSRLRRSSPWFAAGGVGFFPTPDRTISEWSPAGFFNAADLERSRPGTQRASAAQLYDYALNEIEPGLEGIPGVASASLNGGGQPQTNVVVDPIAAQTRGVNSNVYTTAILERLVTIGDATVKIRDGKPVLIRDVACVEDGESPNKQARASQ
jgi:hypothetical protein